MLKTHTCNWRRDKKKSCIPTSVYTRKSRISLGSNLNSITWPAGRILINLLNEFAELIFIQYYIQTLSKWSWTNITSNLNTEKQLTTTSLWWCKLIKVPMKWNFRLLFYSIILKSMILWFVIFEFGLRKSAYEFFLELQSWPIRVKMCDIPRSAKICKLVHLTS